MKIGNKTWFSKTTYKENLSTNRVKYCKISNDMIFYYRKIGPSETNYELDLFQWSKNSRYNYSRLDGPAYVDKQRTNRNNWFVNNKHFITEECYWNY